MSKHTGSNVTHHNFGYRRKISIAYTLNNYQPVRCTIIGDQPLFFMDFEGSFEADSFAAGTEEYYPESLLERGFDPLSSVEAIEKGVEKLQERIMNALDGQPLPAAGHMDTGHIDTASESAMESLLSEEDRAAAAFALFRQDADFICMTSTDNAADNCADNMADDAAYILSLIGQSHFGAALIENARKYETAFVMGGAVSAAQYDRRQNTIFINPHLNEADQLMLVTRELRRVWQHRNGALVHPLTFHPDQAVLVHRAQVADLCVAMVRCAWEMQLSGQGAAWERLENSSMADLTRAFAREAYMDFRSVNNGEASAAVFEAWFLSERCRQEDRRLIQQMLADYQGYVFENINPSTAVTAELILALGSQPREAGDSAADKAAISSATKSAGRNYLAPYVQSIMNDALFTEIRDRSNANFLWFIKFERSFRETEQELQTLDTSSVSGTHQKNQPDAQENSKRFGDQHEQKADIVSLPRGKAHTGLFQGPRFGHGGPAGSATVIEFQKQPQKQPGKA